MTVFSIIIFSVHYFILFYSSVYVCYSIVQIKRRKRYVCLFTIILGLQSSPCMSIVKPIEWCGFSMLNKRHLMRTNREQNETEKSWIEVTVLLIETTLKEEFFSKRSKYDNERNGERTYELLEFGGKRAANSGL